MPDLHCLSGLSQTFHYHVGVTEMRLRENTAASLDRMNHRSSSLQVTHYRERQSFLFVSTSTVWDSVSDR